MQHIISTLTSLSLKHLKAIALGLLMALGLVFGGLKVPAYAQSSPYPETGKGEETGKDTAQPLAPDNQADQTSESVLAEDAPSVLTKDAHAPAPPLSEVTDVEPSQDEVAPSEAAPSELLAPAELNTEEVFAPSVGIPGLVGCGLSGWDAPYSDIVAPAWQCEMLPESPPKDAAPARAPPPAESTLEALAPTTIPSEPISTTRAIRAILALVALMALAYVAGHPVVQRLEQRLRITSVITSGFPFVIMGLVAVHPSVDILSHDIMQEIRPLLPLGLGWIGFVIGFRFDLRRFESLPQGMSAALVLTTLLPLVAMVGVTSAFFGATEGLDEASFLRDAVLLATAGAMTARVLPGVLAARGASSQTVERVARIVQLEELVAFACLIVVTAFFRPTEALGGWRVPAVGWIFVTIGVGCILGGFIFALMRTINKANETLAVMLGAVCFAAGMASHLHLSPIVVCFLAAVLLTNLPGGWKERVLNVLVRLERPVYLVFLVMVGAMWDIGEWKGWLLALLFVATRLSTRLLGVRIFTERYPDAFTPVEQRNLAVSPMGALGIAIVINAQDLYAGSLSTSWIVTAVLVGSLITEVIVQFVSMGKSLDELKPISPMRAKSTVERMAAVDSTQSPSVLTSESSPVPNHAPSVPPSSGEHS